MDKIAIQPPPNPPALTPAVAVPPVPEPATAPPPSRRPFGQVFKQVLSAIASLRVTVVLFVLSIILVLCGTLAQVDQGIWTVVSKYFRSAFVWVPLQIFFPRDVKVGGGFPFPGGWLLGGLLL